MTTATPAPILHRERRVAMGADSAALAYSWLENVKKLDRYLMDKGCIGPDLKARPGAVAPKVAEFKEDGMYPVLDRIRRQHEREGLGSAVRHLFRERYGLEMHYGGNRSRKRA